MFKRRIIRKRDNSRVVVENNRIVGNLPARNQPPSARAGVVNPLWEEDAEANRAAERQLAAIAGAHEQWVSAKQEANPGLEFDEVDALPGPAEAVPERMRSGRQLLDSPVDQVPDRAAEDTEDATRRRANLSASVLGGDTNRFVLGADLRGADLRGVNLNGFTLVKARLSGAKLVNASLMETDLRASDMDFAHLQDADLRGADLRGADLRGVQTGNTDLRGADLRGADVSGADLRGALLWEARLEGVTSDENTRWPDDLGKPAVVESAPI